jgi:hypothetical protein
MDVQVEDAPADDFEHMIMTLMNFMEEGKSCPAL